MAISVVNMKTTCGEWQRSYLYQVQFLSFPVLLAANKSYQKVKGSVLDLYNSKGVWPKVATNAIELQWGDEKVYYAGTDNSVHNGVLDFIDDEAGVMRDLWYSLKDMTGAAANQVTQPKINNIFKLGVYRIDVTKSKIVSARVLQDCQVFEVEETEPDKTSNNLNHIKVTLYWDRNVPDKASVGKVISV